MKLSQLKNGRQAVVKKILFSGEKAVRFNEVGLTEGVTVKAIRRSTFNNLIEIYLRGFNLAIRLADAENIVVEDIV